MLQSDHLPLNPDTATSSVHLTSLGPSFSFAKYLPCEHCCDKERMHVRSLPNGNHLLRSRYRYMCVGLVFLSHLLLLTMFQPPGVQIHRELHPQPRFCPFLVCVFWPAFPLPHISDFSGLVTLTLTSALLASYFYVCLLDTFLPRCPGTKAKPEQPSSSSSV